MNAIPLINNIPKSNINIGSIGGNETQLRQEINTSLVALKKEAGTLEGLINEAAQMLVTINNRIATLENDTVKKSDIVDAVQSGNMNPVTSNAVADYVGSMEFITDANKAIPPNDKEKTYYIYYNGANIPSNVFNFVIVAYNGRTTSGDRRLVQMAYATSNDNYGVIYTRLAFSSDGGTTWTWRNWEKIIKQSEVTTSVASDNYSPIASSGVYNFFVSMLRINNFRVFTIGGDGTQTTLNIRNTASETYTAVGFFIMSRYSTTVIHAEIGSDGSLFQLKSNALLKRGGASVTVSNTTDTIKVSDGYNWNNFIILAFSPKANIINGLTFFMSQ